MNLKQARSSRQLLILDLDETLVSTPEEASFHSAPCDFQIFGYQVWKRPYVELFLATVLEWFDVAVWSASSEAYAEAIVTQLLPDPQRLVFLWGRRRCTWRTPSEWDDFSWLKNLNKVKRCFGYQLESIIMVDDSPEKLARHYGNLVRVTPFEGQADDTELRDLLPFLNYLRTVENVRKIEKRGWRRFEC